MNLSIGGGVKSSRSKDLQNFIIHHPEDNMSLRGAESSATKQSSLLSNVENFDDKTVNSASKKFEQVLNNATLKTVEKTARLPRSQGYLLPRNDMGKAAFTLAEVLITLGIIGVVAAMTLPTLISNYQKRVYVTQLKKSVSVLSQGFTTMMGHDGVTELKDTEAFSGMGTNTCSQVNILTDNCRSIREGLQNVFSGIQFVPCDGTQIKELNGSNRGGTKSGTCIEFPDGSEIFSSGFLKNPSSHTHPTGGLIGEIFIDINGSKNPNTWGRDVFWLVIANNGTVYGMSSQPGAELYGMPIYWRTTNDQDFKCIVDRGGYGCAGRVLEEDAMNY